MHQTVGGGGGGGGSIWGWKLKKKFEGIGL